MPATWAPRANRLALEARAALLRALRGYFEASNALEVETPLLGSNGVTDPSLTAITAETATGRRFLQTSPEYAMKRLLAAQSGDIFQICKAFRADECGRRHNPEYTLLEWYRLGWDHRQLAREAAELVCRVLERDGWQVWSYRTLFQHVLGVDPFLDSRDTLETATRTLMGSLPDSLSRDGLLDLMMVSVIEPRLSDWGVVVVTDYPASQAALARTASAGGVTIGCRFEIYVDGIELANGYWELDDVDELRARFAADNARRIESGMPEMAMDAAMLAAHEAGLPTCAGVALGIDRLLALQLGVADIRDTLAFDWDRS